MVEKQKNNSEQDTFDTESLSDAVEAQKNKIGVSLGISNPEALDGALDDFLVADARNTIEDAEKDGVISPAEKNEINYDVAAVIVHSIDHGLADTDTPADRLIKAGYDKEMTESSGLFGRRQYGGVNPVEFVKKKVEAVRKLPYERKIGQAQALVDSGISGNRLKFDDMVKSGKISAVDERIQRLKVRRIRDGVLQDHSGPYSDPDVSHYFKDAPIEYIVSDEQAVEMLINSFIQTANKHLDPESGSNPSLRYGFPLERTPNLLSVLLENREYLERIADQVDVQEYGKQALADAMIYTLNREDFFDEDNTKRREEVVNNMATLRKLGFHPLADDASFNLLLSSYNAERLQLNMDALGLIEPDVVDRMYAYEFNRLKGWSERRIEDNSTSQPDNNSLAFKYASSSHALQLRIHEQLLPSEQNVMANYWRSQSEGLGEGAMEFVFEVIANSRGRQGGEIDIDALFTPDGMPSQELFRNNLDYDYTQERSEHNRLTPLGLVFENVADASGYRRRAMNFLAQNIDMIPESDYKGFVKTWSEIGSGLEDAEAEKKLGSFMSIAQSGNHLTADLFDENGVTDKFYGDALSSTAEYRQWLYQADSNWQLRFSKGEIKYIEFIEKNDIALPDVGKSSRSQQQQIIDGFFDEDGPKPALWHHFYHQGRLDVIVKQNEDTLSGMEFSAKQLKAIEIFSTIDNTALQEIFIQFLLENLDDVGEEQIEQVPLLLGRLSHSNASEIREHQVALARRLLRDETPFASLEKIEDVFLRNNLPFVGKAYVVFELLNPAEKMHSTIDDGYTTSPTLKEAPKEGLGGRSAIILSDLLKSSFGSNNRSLKGWLGSIGDGQELMERLSSGDESWINLSTEESRTLRDFMGHLKAAYNRTEKGQQNPYRQRDDVSVREDIAHLTELFGPTDRYTLPDRIVRSFAYPMGIRSFAEAVRYTEQKVAEADMRNRQAARRELVLEDGDFIKGIGDIKYLENILQNGSVAKEYLGDSATSDSTPLDTDVSRIMGSPTSLSSGIGGTISKDYGPIFFVLKSDDRFAITRGGAEEGQAPVDSGGDRSKIEVFSTGGGSNKGHYGIRTGFASSEINYIVTESFDPRVGLEIASNGFYIPVVDKTSGEVVFTPEDYDALRAKMSGLSYYGVEEYRFAPNLLLPEVRELTSEIANNEQETARKRSVISSTIQEAMRNIGLALKERIDGDLTPGSVELLDTGSTGRGTNMPGDGDFDFMMRVDKSVFLDPARMSEIKRRLGEKFGGNTIGSGDFRLKGVHIDGLDEPVDIDITFIEKTNKLDYSSDRSLGDRLETIKQRYPEQYELTVANVLLAKKTLKAAGAYKPNRGDNPQGGLGGIGIENWVLQNGGSFEAAARGFMDAAGQKTFEEFKIVYHVWDFGKNHLAARSGRYPHDNFVASNMSAEGFEKMKEALASYFSAVA